MAPFLLVSSLLAIAPLNQVAAQTKQSTATSAPKHSGNWDDMSAMQQKILASLEEDWKYLSKKGRQKWIQVANLYPKMKRADQEWLQSRMNKWSKLSQKDRCIARDNYLSSLRFPAEEKASAWQAYQQIGPEDKKKPTAASAPTLQNRPNPAPTVMPAAAPNKDDDA